jgi:hypothetical protein
VHDWNNKVFDLHTRVKTPTLDVVRLGFEELVIND